MWQDKEKIRVQGAAKAVRSVLCARSTQHLDATIRQLLTNIVFITVLQALRKGKNTKYCTIGRKSFSKTTGVSLATVTGYTNRLHNSLLIEKTHRRQVNGMWVSNMYRLGVVLVGMVDRITIEYIKILNRVKQTLHLVSDNSSIKIFREENKVSNLHSLAPPVEPAFVTDFRLRRPDLYGA